MGSFVYFYSFLGRGFALRIGRTAKLNRRFGGESRNPGKPDLNRRLRERPNLKNELEIVNEKIEDAKSENDKKAKYELMRIRNKLVKDIERIEYNLN